MTLVDALDTLAVMGEWKKFEEGMNLLKKRMYFESDLRVNVFETTIRGLGGESSEMCKDFLFSF